MSRQGHILASACSLVFFLVLVAVQPLLEPSYDSLRQGISEFMHTDAGPVVLGGFGAWAVSLALLGGLLGGEQGSGRSRQARLEAGSLYAAAAGLGLVAVFATDRGAEAPGIVAQTTTAGRLHDVGSGLITVAFLAAVAADAFREREIRLAGTVIGAAVLSSVFLFALGDPLPGLRQRCLVACACIWQIAVLRRLWLDRATSDRSSEDSRCSTS